MPIFLFLLFIAVPIAEIVVFIEAGRVIGIIPTILLTIGTAIAGSVLLRIQGFAVLNRFSESMQKGEMPVGAVVEGAAIMAGGLLLLTPGLLTDAFGLLLFVPVFRQALAGWIFKRLAVKGKARFYQYRQSAGTGQPRPESGPKDGGIKRSENVIDAEFETVDPTKHNETSGAGTPLGNDKRKQSPWRKS